jgi:hypothetical protein
MAMQLIGDTVLSRRLRDPWDRVVVLERLARAGGAVKWYFIRSQEDFDRVLLMFRGGSCVSLYFADQLHVELDTDRVRQRMFDVVTSEGELVAGYPSGSDPEVDIEVISGPGELGSYLMSHPEGLLIVWGIWPARDNNGYDAITIDLVDQDGILRNHPH